MRIEFPWKRRKKVEDPRLIDPNYYQEVIDLYNSFCCRNDVTQCERLHMLQYLLSLIKKEWQYRCLTKPLYMSEVTKKECDLSFLYSYCCFAKGIDIDTHRQVNGKIVDLGKDVVAAFPWKRSRCGDAVLILGKEDFVYDRLNHMGDYFLHMDFGCMTNGYHSTTAGIAYKKGTLPLDLLDDAFLFDTLTTDGKQWYNAATGSAIMDVSDFREALIFQLSKIYYNMTNPTTT